MPKKKKDKPKKEKAKKGDKKGAKKEEKKEEPEQETKADGEENEEDLLGDNQWAQTGEDEFSGAVGDMFADLFGADPSKAADDFAEEQRKLGNDPNAKMGQMGEDAGEAEAAEEAEQARIDAEAAADEAKKQAAAEKRAARANMTPEQKKAKIKCDARKRSAAKAAEDGALADEEAYGRAEVLYEELKFEEAEAEYKAAMGSGDEAEVEAGAPGGLPAEYQAAVDAITAAAAEIDPGGGPSTLFKVTVGWLKHGAAADKDGKVCPALLLDCEDGLQAPRASSVWAVQYCSTARRASLQGDGCRTETARGKWRRRCRM
jgi:colicin import membrane protein